MKYSYYPFLNKLSIITSAMCWLITLVSSILIAGMCIYYQIAGRSLLFECAVGLGVAGMHIFATLTLRRAFAEIDRTRRTINEAFWSQVPPEIPWLRAVPTVILMSLALMMFSYLIGYADFAWCMVTHRIVPSLVAAHAKDFSELIGLKGFNLFDSLFYADLLAGSLFLAFLAYLIKVFLPNQVQQWNAELTATDDESMEIRLLDLMTTTNLYIENWQAAQETSSELLKLAQRTSRHTA